MVIQMILIELLLTVLLLCVLNEILNDRSHSICPNAFLNHRAEVAHH